MTSGLVVTMASLTPPKWNRNVSQWSWVYFKRTCTGLRAIARESMNERNRKTTGTVWGKITPLCPGASGYKHAVPSPAIGSGAPGGEQRIPRRFLLLFSTRRRPEVAIQPLAQNGGRFHVVWPKG